MEKTMNLLIMNMKKDILKVINNEDYNFPIIVKQMVVNEIKQLVDSTVESILEQEFQQFKDNNDNKEVE